MKKIFTILAAVLITASLWAQSPKKMSYQAVIRNSSNGLVKNTQVGMQISILQGSPGGTLVYIETQTPTTNANGLVSIEIGEGTGFDTITWANGPYYIKIETAVAAPLTTYTITGTSQLLTVPYALYADKAGNGFSGNFNDLINLPVNLDIDRTNDVIITGNQTIAGNKTFTGTVAADSLVLTKKTSKYAFNTYTMIPHPSSIPDITISHSEYLSYISSSTTGVRYVMIGFDLPSQILGVPQKIKSVTINYQCESANVSITALFLRKSNKGTMSYMANPTVNLTSTTAAGYTFSPSGAAQIFTDKRVYLDIGITFNATGVTDRLRIFEVIVETY